MHGRSGHRGDATGADVLGVPHVEWGERGTTAHHYSPALTPQAESALRERWQSGEVDSHQVAVAQRAYDLAVERIFHDLPPGWVPAAVAIDFGRSPPYRFVAPDGTWWESDVPVTGLTKEATVEAASRLQVDIARTWYIEWPSCSVHGGQMTPTVQSGRAVWACDRGDTRVKSRGMVYDDHHLNLYSK